MASMPTACTRMWRCSAADSAVSSRWPPQAACQVAEQRVVLSSAVGGCAVCVPPLKTQHSRAPSSALPLTPAVDASVSQYDSK
jgi:hypothetical protein